MDVIDFDKVDLDEIAMRVRRGDVFVYPTDTLYGIGCDALNELAVERISEIKGREKNKPLSVAFSDTKQLLEFVELDKAVHAELEKKLPGPYTFIVKNRNIPPVVTGGLESVGVRIPDFDPLLRLIKKVNSPIITTSANLSGNTPAKRLDEIDDAVLDSLDFALNTRHELSGKASAVINLITGKRLR